jgi:hypothetical protein
MWRTHPLCYIPVPNDELNVVQVASPYSLPQGPILNVMRKGKLADRVYNWMIEIAYLGESLSFDTRRDFARTRETHKVTVFVNPNTVL